MWVAADVTPGGATTASPAGEPPVTTFSDPGHRLRRPRGIAAGPDGNLWVTTEADRIGARRPHSVTRAS
jgi:streptogramin lyase